MFNYRITKTTTTESSQQFKVKASSEEEAIELADTYEDDIAGKIIEIPGGFIDIGNTEIVAEEIQRRKQQRRCRICNRAVGYKLEKAEEKAKSHIHHQTNTQEIIDNYNGQFTYDPTIEIAYPLDYTQEESKS